jgi:hypothetical protein
VLKPQVVPSSMLWPPSVTLPKQLPPEVLFTTIVLVTVSVPPLLAMAPPPRPPALLPEKVLLVTATVPDDM